MGIPRAHARFERVKFSVKIGNHGRWTPLLGGMSASTGVLSPRVFPHQIIGTL
jgi:hypothetical protein